MSSDEVRGPQSVSGVGRPRPLQSAFAVLLIAGCIGTYAYYAFVGAAERGSRARSAEEPPSAEALQGEAEAGVESLRTELLADLDRWLDELRPNFAAALADPAAPAGGLLFWDAAGSALLPRSTPCERVAGLPPGDSRYTRQRSDGTREGIEIDARRVLAATLHRLGRDNGTADYWYELRGDLGDGGSLEVCYRAER